MLKSKFSIQSKKLPNTINEAKSKFIVSKDDTSKITNITINNLIHTVKGYPGYYAMRDPYGVGVDGVIIPPSTCNLMNRFHDYITRTHGIKTYNGKTYYLAAYNSHVGDGEGQSCFIPKYDAVIQFHNSWGGSSGDIYIGVCVATPQGWLPYTNGLMNTNDKSHVVYQPLKHILNYGEVRCFVQSNDVQYGNFSLSGNGYSVVNANNVLNNPNAVVMNFYRDVMLTAENGVRIHSKNGYYCRLYHNYRGATVNEAAVDQSYGRRIRDRFNANFWCVEGYAIQGGGFGITSLCLYTTQRICPNYNFVSGVKMESLPTTNFTLADKYQNI